MPASISLTTKKVWAGIEGVAWRLIVENSTGQVGLEGAGGRRAGEQGTSPTSRGPPLKLDLTCRVFDAQRVMHMKRLHGTVGTPRGPVGFGLPRRRDAAAAHLAAAHLAAALVTMLCGCASVVGNSGAPRHRGFLGWAPGLPPRLLWRERRLMALRMCDSPMNGEGLQPAQPPVRAVPPPQQRPTAGHDASAPPARRTDEEGSLRGGLRGRDHRGRGSITVSRHGGSAMDMYDYRPGKAVWERGSIPARGRGARGQAAGRLRSGKGSRGGGLKIPLREIGRPADVARDLMAHVDRKTLPSDAREGYGRGRGRGAASGRGWQEYNTRGRGPDMRPDSAPDSGASAGWGRKIAGESLVPKNLAAYSSIEELLLIFETAIANRSTSLRELVEPPDAVAALNHFKRLQRQTRGKPELAARFDHVLAELVGVAEVGIPYMSAKNIALALNSLSHRHEFSSLFQAAVQRIQMLCDTGFLFHTQSLAMIVNALVKRRMLDAALVRAISEAAQRIEPDSYSPQVTLAHPGARARCTCHTCSLPRRVCAQALVCAPPGSCTDYGTAAVRGRDSERFQQSCPARRALALCLHVRGGNAAARPEVGCAGLRTAAEFICAQRRA